MNDCAMIPGIKKILERNSDFNQCVKGIFTHVPEEILPPYCLLEFESVRESVERYLVCLNLQVFSTYAGLWEIQGLLQKAKTLLEGQAILGGVSQDSPILAGFIKIMPQKIELLKDGVTRRGTTPLEILLRPMRR